MDLSSTKYLEPATLFSCQGGEGAMEGNNGLCMGGIKNPFLDSFSDPLCKLNLKETSDFVKSFPVGNGAEGRGISEISVTRRNVEAPPTPGRPVFSFSNTSNFARKSFPSKWDDAEKWILGGSSCNDSPANNHGLFKSLDHTTSRMYSRQCSGYKPNLGEICAEKSRITEEKVSKVISSFQGPLVLDHHHSRGGPVNGVALSASEDILLKDKFPNELNQIIPKFGCSEPMQEGFLFGNSFKKSTEITEEVKHRDIGTEMTPLGSSTTSRCPTPFKSTSPARHTTPANRSGPLAPGGADTMDITQLQECHLAKLHLGTQFDSVASNWSSREEEEEDVSKSLRHFEMSTECRKSVSESRSAGWQEEEKTKSCLRYQREEANIEAWVNLQSAKAEAESRKLEVKIQKMRANLEEKLMKRMADVHRKAEEWRAEAQFQHSEQVRKVGLQAQKVMNRRKHSKDNKNNNNSHFSGHKSCGCFPCNNHL
ncbi:hypothetical protein SASPL_141767 [Salvia splendens]|uniref:Remorin C-terminal domain-containing protein n=1 Tax=Salvia splendens TaxID=180675 RepID=A0A8X8WJR4_SALSN|nr:uncharacterized protein LOC121770772 isoform X2 [Salvia splendens]KAG6395644.1 hypothetical protein SASPL_141767 [Salvia splendens]